MAKKFRSHNVNPDANLTLLWDCKLSEARTHACLKFKSNNDKNTNSTLVQS